ncbi:MAG: VOC family protein [Streptosporangiaceae bacterium]
MPHPIVHAEIRSNDPDATRQFFADLLGWTYPDPGAIPGHTFVDTGVPGALYTASVVAQSDRDLCLSVNASRVQQASLWNYILSLSQPPTTPAERERVARFKAHLQQLFTPRDCAHVNPDSP